MIRAVIFDMDGVIVESEPFWEKSTWEYVRMKRGTVNLRAFRSRDLDEEVRGRTQPFIAKYLKRHLKLPDSPRKIIDDRLKILFRLFDRSLQLEPGALPLFKTLAKNHVPIVLASSSPRRVVTYMLRRFHIRKYFTKILTGDDMKFSKPNPWVYRRAAKLLRIKPNQMLVIEDSISGVQSGLRSGAKVIAVKKPYTPQKYTRGVIRTINSLSQINPKYLQAI